MSIIQGIEFVVMAGINEFFCIRKGIEIICFIEWDVESETHNS